MASINDYAKILCEMDKGKREITIADMKEVLADINKTIPGFYRIIRQTSIDLLRQRGKVKKKKWFSWE